MNGKKTEEKDKGKEKPGLNLEVFFPTHTTKQWDPTKVAHQYRFAKTGDALCRIKKDLISLFQDPAPGLFVVPDPTDFMVIHSIIIGPIDTPYEGGIFYFLIRCTPKYPIEPPLVKLMTTDGGRVRFNPNLYANGKVCLSILGTWNGPAWSPAQQISSVLLSIQSLMTENPYYNEPGIICERIPGEAKHYNDIILHETLRVAVCGMIENDTYLNIPPELVSACEGNFTTFYEHYLAAAQSKVHLDGSAMRDPFCESKKETRIFNFKRIIERLNKIYERVEAKKKAESTSSKSSDDTSNDKEKSLPASEALVENKRQHSEDYLLDFLYDSSSTSSEN